jgi:hypothetical protein
MKAANKIAIFLFFSLQLAYSEEGTTTRLSWAPVPYISQYEVIVQRMDEGGNYVDEDRTISLEPFVDYALAPGKYRYRIITYNLRRRASTQSDYLEFEIMEKTFVENQGTTEQIIKNNFVIDNLIKTNDENKSRYNMEIYAALQYAPLIPVAKGERDKGFFVEGVQSKNAAFKIDFIPLDNKRLKLGFEVNVSLGSILTDTGESTLERTLLGINTGIIFQFPIMKRMFFNLRGEGGVSYIFNYYESENSETTKRSPQIQAGISLQYVFGKHFFIDVGMDYRSIFLSRDLNVSFISPTIALCGCW